MIKREWALSHNSSRFQVGGGRWKTLGVSTGEWARSLIRRKLFGSLSVTEHTDAHGKEAIPIMRERKRDGC